jgi:hypothetical protein
MPLAHPRGLMQFWNTWVSIQWIVDFLGQFPSALQGGKVNTNIATFVSRSPIKLIAWLGNRSSATLYMVCTQYFVYLPSSAHREAKRPAQYRTSGREGASEKRRMQSPLCRGLWQTARSVHKICKSALIMPVVEAASRPRPAGCWIGTRRRSCQLPSPTARISTRWSVCVRACGYIEGTFIL